jgi:nitrogen fixation NifU-like protein
MQKIYLNKIKEHYRHPLNEGKLSHPTHVGEVLNPICGDEIKVYLEVKNGVLKDVKYEVQSCMIGVAGASLLSEKIKGKTVGELKKLEKSDIEELFGFKITVAREGCATLALTAIKKSIS